MNLTEIFEYLNRLGLADQVHLRDGDQVVFYHWNRAMSDLIPSLIIKKGKIEKILYERTIVPKLYILVNKDFINDFNDEHKFVRDKRGKD